MERTPYVCVLVGLHDASLVSLFVLPDGQISIHDGEDGHQQRCDHNSLETRSIDRSIFRLEEKRANKIPKAVPQENPRS